MLWLYLLAALTVLTIALRRVLRRQTPLNDDLYMSKVAVEHVHSGVCWVRADGKIGTANLSLAESLGQNPKALFEQEWLVLFPSSERRHVQQAFTQMLLAGISSVDTFIESMSGEPRPANVRLVAVHDHKMRLRGHHCLIQENSSAA